MCKFLKESCKVESWKSCHFGKCIHIDIFCAVLWDVVTYIHESADVFFVFCGRLTKLGDSFFHAASTYIDHESDEKGVDCSTRIGLLCFVLITCLVDVIEESFGKLFVFFSTDDDTLTKGMEEWVQGSYVSDKAVVEEDDYSLSVFLMLFYFFIN